MLVDFGSGSPDASCDYGGCHHCQRFSKTEMGKTLAGSSAAVTMGPASPTASAPAPAPSVVPITPQAAQKAMNDASHMHGMAQTEYAEVKESKRVLDDQISHFTPDEFALQIGGTLERVAAQFEQDHRLAGEKVGSTQRVQSMVEKDMHDVISHASQNDKEAGR